MWPPSLRYYDEHTLMTFTFKNKGFDSAGPADLMGLVLLLCPGVELALLAERCELRRCGIGKRTMTDEKDSN